jgi:hypothetical protein
MVVLEILGTKIEDSGTYTCRATNKWGRAEISVELECVEKLKGQKPQFTSHIQVRAWLRKLRIFTAKIKQQQLLVSV